MFMAPGTGWPSSFPPQLPLPPGPTPIGMETAQTDTWFPVIDESTHLPAIRCPCPSPSPPPSPQSGEGPPAIPTVLSQLRHKCTNIRQKPFLHSLPRSADMSRGLLWTSHSPSQWKPSQAPQPGPCPRELVPLTLPHLGSFWTYDEQPAVSIHFLGRG